jgi:hypothetical protein
MTVLEKSPKAGEKIGRRQFETILRTALLMEEYRFARQAALAWLANFPGDLPINLLYAQSLIKAGLPDQATAILEKICQNDPEYLEAVESLVYASHLHRAEQSVIYPKSESSGNQDVLVERLSWLQALGGNPNARGDIGLSRSLVLGKTSPSWSWSLSKSRQALQQNDIECAEKEIQTALGANTSCPLVPAIHLKILLARLAANGSGAHLIRSLATYYRQQWSECIVCTLSLAEALMDSGEPENAVALLHEAVTKDITGQVANRLWGSDHPYRDLWPSDLEMELEIPIPASIASALGWNAIPHQVMVISDTQPIPVIADQNKTTDSAQDPGQELVTRTAPNHSQGEAETLRSVQAELERISARLNRPGLAQADGRFPIYVIMTTRQGMEKRFGSQSTNVIESEMLRLVSAIQQRNEWGALLFYADQATFIRSDRNHQLRLDRPAARADDPWALKLALLDLDSSLKKRGERIGAVLIVGGPEVVPFHHLPNPVDDGDDDVPSDNPYATSDENYFIPEWPIGRLPVSQAQQTDDLQSLLYSLTALTARHQSLVRSNASATWYRRWVKRFAGWLRSRAHLPSHVRQSFGYTAAIWRQASINVFRPIGEPRSLHTSPPEGNSPSARSNGHSTALPPARLGYFNLHGLIDAPEWYGQRDSGSNGLPGIVGDGEDYPVALRPSDVTNSGRAPQVVFSEACYGAHIINKTTSEAMALKFLQAGVQAYIGSTCISYGAIRPPLIAADFLGHAFWSYLREGLPAGESLRRAKISLAREMHTRQGYLDGEDQKTLISFVLYGDPLAVPEGLEFASKKFQRPAKPPANIRTVCDLAHDGADKQPVPQELLEYVKSVVEQYLPGMAGSELTLSYEHIDCDAAQPKHSPMHPNLQDNQTVDHLTGHQPFQLARKVVTLSKEVPNSTHRHHHYARLTLDAQGKLVKLAVSR